MCDTTTRPLHLRQNGPMTYTRHRVAHHLLLTLLLFTAGCGSDQYLTRDITSWSVERKRMTTDSEEYVIQAGDQVELTVPDYPEFNVSETVREDGMITLPVIGDTPARGATKGQLNETIGKRLSSYVTTTVRPSIRIKGALEQKLVILGSVTNQGTFVSVTPISPFQALAFAGGPSANADLRHVRVFRGGDSESTVELDLSASLATLPGRNETLPLIYPGDLMYVPREENVIRDFADLLRDVIVLFGIFAIIR